MPPADSPLLQAERHNWKYWREDGIPRLLGGLCGTAYSMPLSITPSPPPWVSLVGIGIALLWLPLSRPAIEYLKARLVWPRSGYVRPPYFAEVPLPGAEPVEPRFLSIQTAEMGETELQELRRRRYWHSLLLLFILVALNHFVLCWQDGRTAARVLLGVSITATFFGMFRLFLFLHRHPRETS